MTKIFKSIAMIIGIAAIAGGATWSYFSSKAQVTGNTFSTGTLEIRVDGQATKAGFEFKNAKPGDCKEGSYGINNYGAPYFGGPSTLAAKYLKLNLANKGGDATLCDALTFEIKKDAGGVAEDVYSGNFNGLFTPKDILMSYYQTNGLIPGSTNNFSYKICLPDSGNQSALQGKTCTFDFSVEGRTSNN